MFCKNCLWGKVPDQIYYVTHEMAVDAGIPELEGSTYEETYKTCPCCLGDYTNCNNCITE